MVNIEIPKFEPPNLKAPAEALRRLSSSLDAQKWAQSFNRLIEGLFAKPKALGKGLWGAVVGVFDSFARLDFFKDSSDSWSDEATPSTTPDRVALKRDVEAALRDSRDPEEAPPGDSAACPPEEEEVDLDPESAGEDPAYYDRFGKAEALRESDFGAIRSFGTKRDPDTGASLCARVGRYNLAQFGIEAARRGGARAVFEYYRCVLPPHRVADVTTLGEAHDVVLSSGYSYADLFVKGTSRLGQKHGHRAMAFSTGRDGDGDGKPDWFILDPYREWKGEYTHEPIPFDEYTGQILTVVPLNQSIRQELGDAKAYASARRRRPETERA